MPRRRKKQGRLVLAAAMLAMPLVGILAYSYYYYSRPDARGAGEFVVGAGEPAAEVAARLREAGVVRSEGLFLLALRNLGLDGELKPGEHDLAGAKTYAEIAERLATERRVRDEVTLTVREGWTLRDIQAELARLGHPAAERFFEVAGSPARLDYEPPPAWLERYPFLAARRPGSTLEGFMFPDTYRLFADASAEGVAEKLLANFGRRVDAGLTRAIGESGRGFMDVVVVASMLEREVRQPATMRMVADIFWRRLALGMRLQADSTVNYVTGGARSAVTLEELETESLYNTYRHGGLPPGPIGNPGLEAIRAAIDPTPNDYLYFLTDADGGIHYARTFDEHVRNKSLYLR
jgi:UPF0755 protein